MEDSIVPAAGYELHTVDMVPSKLASADRSSLLAIGWSGRVGYCADTMSMWWWGWVLSKPFPRWWVWFGRVSNLGFTSRAR